MAIRKWITSSVEETEAAGREFAAQLRPGDVVALRGGLGAGKTAFVRGIASLLAPEARVSSPTFALMHEYAGEMPLYHFDL
jgi:tRNA threonylcarbamoyladenosine biosynthesis protein TsaE